MDERALDCPEDRPLVAWRFFRVRPSPEGFVLTAPLIHDPDFERFVSRRIDAVCYGHDHPAPAPGCRCGLYGAIEGTLDSLAGYLEDSSHDDAPVLYAEVACTGRVFIDARGVRAQRVEILRLASPGTLFEDPDVHRRALADLERRYGIEIDDGLGAVPDWLLGNVAAQGAPPPGTTIDLDALLFRVRRFPSGATGAASRRIFSD